MTYLNIWGNFTKWVIQNTENNFVLNIYPLGLIRYIDDKASYGINIKISDSLLFEFNLRWDENRFNCEKDVTNNMNMMKLNYYAISTNLSISKTYIRNGLQNLFKACLVLMSENKTSVIDLGPLGNFYCKNSLVFQIPCKQKNVVSSNKKISIRTLLEKPSTRLENDMKKVNSINLSSKDMKKGDLNQISNRKENFKETEFTLKNFNLEVNDKYYNKDSQTFNPTIISNRDPGTGNKQYKTGNLVSELKPIKKEITIPLPNNERHWKLQDMLSVSFAYHPKKISNVDKIFFNVYSNTKAAPFTGEKTQIPICHRIGSFYSLTLQNYVIDRTTKCIKILYDEYFTRIYSLNMEIPASEEEEYKFRIGEYDNEEKVHLRKVIYNIYMNTIRNSITDDYISDIKEKWLVNIVKLCLRAYKLTKQQDYDELLNHCIREILENYKFSMKKSIIDYMLKHPELREKLGIPIPFRKIKEYAEAKVTRPSDNDQNWKSTFTNNKLKLSTNLMLMSDNITKVLKYYIQNLRNSLYLTIPSNYTTMSLMAFIEMQNNKKEEQRKIVGEDWKKYVENVLKENKIYKDQLFIYFKSVSAVMSSQLRELIIDSMKRFHKFICQFKKDTGKYASAEDVFKKQFKNNFQFEQSFLEISIIAGKNGFSYSEDLKEIHNKIINLVQDVIKCSREVERPDNMFIKNLEKQANLWEVPINDPEVTHMINDIDTVVKDNIDTIEKVLDLYSQFDFVNSEREILEQMEIETNNQDKYTLLAANNPVVVPVSNTKKEKKDKNNPKGNDKDKDNHNHHHEPEIKEDPYANFLTRQNIEKKIALYEEKIKILREDYPNTLYMNMIKIDCSIVNNFLRKELFACIDMLLKFIFKVNISKKSKALNEEIEKLKEKLNSIANTELDLFNMERDFEDDKQKKIPELYTDYEDFLDWVFFYWKYDIYPKGEESGKTGGTEIISNIDNIIKECFTNVSAIQNFMASFVTHNLKEKKSAFEANLQKDREEMNKDITAKKAEWDMNKQLAADSINHSDDNFVEDLEIFKTNLLNLKKKLEAMIEKEGLLGTYATDDPRLDQCLKELSPLLKLFNFIKEMRLSHQAYDKQIVSKIVFKELIALSEKSNEIQDLFFECTYIKKAKLNSLAKDMESFRLSVEIGNHIFNLIELIIRFDVLMNEDPSKIPEESRIIVEENKIYSTEFTKLVFRHEKGQEFLLSAVFKNCQTNDAIENFSKNRSEVEKLLEEWGSVKQIYESVSSIAINCNIEFETDKFKDKVYRVIKHDNFKEIKEVVNKNIDELTKNLENVENLKYESATVEKMKKFRKNMIELNEIINIMEDQQFLLENNMLRQDIYMDSHMYENRDM